MKIQKLIVVDENGRKHTWVGEGFFIATNSQEKSSSGGMAKIVGKAIDAHLIVPAEVS